MVAAIFSVWFAANGQLKKFAATQVVRLMTTATGRRVVTTFMVLEVFLASCGVID